MASAPAVLESTCTGTDICCGGACEAGPNCGCDLDADCEGDAANCLVGVCNVDENGVGTCGTESTCTGTDICCSGACKACPNCGCDLDADCEGDAANCLVGVCNVDENGVGTCGTESTCTGTDICCSGACEAGPNCGCDLDADCEGDAANCLVGVCNVDEDGVGTCGTESTCTGTDICCSGACEAGPNCGCDLDADCEGDAANCLVGVCNVDEDGVGTCGTESTCTGTDICCSGACEAGPNCGCDLDADCEGDAANCLVGVCNVDENGVGTCDTESTCTGTDICCGGACEAGPNCGCDLDADCEDMRPTVWSASATS